MSFLHTNGTAAAHLRSLRKAPALKWGKFDVRTQGDAPSRLIIGIGQMHPVLRGRFERFQAKRIASIQAWIFRACDCMVTQENVRCFGKEGFGTRDRNRGEARLTDAALEAVTQALQKAGSPTRLLRDSAQQWRRALRRGHLEDARAAMMTLDALSVLQAIRNQMTVFPLELTTVHAAVSANVDTAQDRLDRIESSSAFLSARAKEGRGLSEEEVHAVMERNALVESFNRALADPERDMVIFDAVLARANENPLTVFVLGQGHRRGMLALAKRHLPDDTLFVWITPPQLWLWNAVLQWTGWLLLLSVLIGLVFLAMR